MLLRFPSRLKMEHQSDAVDHEAAISMAGKDGLKQSETVAAGELLANYSEAEKASALRKLDWHLITL